MYIKYRFRSPSTGVCVFLAQGNKFFGEALGFFGLVPGRGYGFVGEERGDEVTQESLSMRGLAAKMAVFQRSTGHGKEEMSGEAVLKEMVGRG